jgi:TetR/AcrR family transcriptional regulator
MNAAARKHTARGVAAPRPRGSLDGVLIEAAMDLFAAYGYRGTSLARIARAAGVTKGALYWHFADKEDFFVAVAERVLEDWRVSLESREPATTRAEYEAEFIDRFKTAAKLNEHNPWVSRLLLIVSLESHKIGPRVLRMIRKQNLRGFAQLHDLVNRGKQLGALDPELDAEWAASQIFACYLGLATLWYLHGERFKPSRSLDRMARELLHQWKAA